MNHFIKVSILSIVITAISLHGSAQKNTSSGYKMIYGKWKVEEHINLLKYHDAPDSSKETSYNDNENCPHSEVTIDKNKIVIEPKETCEFIPCYPLKMSEIREMPELTDQSLYYQFDGAEIVEYKQVGPGFLNLIGSKENFLKYIDTNCLCGNFTYTLKIILVDDNRIVLFSGVDILLLSRK